MANFYTDNSDIQFLLSHIDLGRLAEISEKNFKFASEFDYAPSDAGEAVENYRLVLESIGRLCGDFIAPRAESVDRERSEREEINLVISITA